VTRGRALLREYDGLRGELRSEHGTLAGDVRVGMVPSLVRLVVVPLYRRVRELHPRILLHVTEGSSSELDAWRMSGTIDVSLHFRHSRNEMQDEEPLAEVANYLVAPLGDTLTRTGRVELTALAGIPLLIPGPPNGARLHLEQLAHKRGIPLRVALEASTLNVQAELTAAGCGYSIMPAHAARAQVEDGRLQAALIDDAAFVRTITLAITPALPASAAVREVARLARSILQDALLPPAARSD